MATIERPKSAQVVAHATEYPADRDGDGTGYGRRQKRNAERQDPEPGAETPAVLVDADHTQDHTLDGMAAYKAAALQALEPGIDHSPAHPLQDTIDHVPAENVRHAYLDHGDDDEPHAVNVAT